jgi:hypothetical protein
MATVQHASRRGARSFRARGRSGREWLRVRPHPFPVIRPPGCSACNSGPPSPPRIRSRERSLQRPHPRFRLRQHQCYRLLLAYALARESSGTLRQLFAIAMTRTTIGFSPAEYGSDPLRPRISATGLNRMYGQRHV